jgi:hypothetical protein
VLLNLQRLLLLLAWDRWRLLECLLAAHSALETLDSGRHIRAAVRIYVVRLQVVAVD